MFIVSGARRSLVAALGSIVGVQYGSPILKFSDRMGSENAKRGIRLNSQRKVFGRVRQCPLVHVQTRHVRDSIVVGYFRLPSYDLSGFARGCNSSYRGFSDRVNE